MSFQGYFSHFSGFGVIFVVLDILRLFWSIKRFRGIFFGNFVILGVFGEYIDRSSDFKAIFFSKNYYFIRGNYQNIKESLNTPRPLKLDPPNCQNDKSAPRLSKTLENDQNAPRRTSIPPKTFKIPKTPSKPQN